MIDSCEGVFARPLSGVGDKAPLIRELPDHLYRDLGGGLDVSLLQALSIYALLDQESAGVIPSPFWLSEGEAFP